MEVKQSSCLHVFSFSLKNSLSSEHHFQMEIYSTGQIKAVLFQTMFIFQHAFMLLELNEHFHSILVRFKSWFMLSRKMMLILN